MAKKKSNAGEPGVFIIPEGGDYFCLCHRRFWERKPSMESHMEQGKAKKEAGPKAEQCGSCFRWFSTKHELKHHKGRVGGTHTLPDLVDRIDIGVEVTNENGETDMIVQSTRVLCVNTEGAHLHDFEPKDAALVDW